MVKHSHDSLNDLEEKLTEQLAGENKALFLRFRNAYAEFVANASWTPSSPASAWARRLKAFLDE